MKQVREIIGAIRRTLRSKVRVFCAMVWCFMLTATLPSAWATDVTLNKIVTTLADYVVIAGGVIAAWGAVVLGSNIKDHNGPGINNGIWTIVGGGVIIAAAAILRSVV